MIVGGGAAGFAAAETLRREQYQGSIVMLSDDAAAPVDRPNLSKDYLAGRAPEDWIPLRPDSFYAENGIDLRLNGKRHRHRRACARGHARRREQDCRTTGCCSRPAPSRFASRSPARTCRMCTRCARSPTAAPSSTRAKTARRAVVLGASFIGLEVAAALRARDIEVHVVAPDKRPMERILGPQIGDFVRALHEEHGVHLPSRGHREHHRRQAGRAEERRTLDADLVVAGIGVRPRIALAEKAGLAHRSRRDR